MVFGGFGVQELRLAGGGFSFGSPVGLGGALKA